LAATVKAIQVPGRRTIVESVDVRDSAATTSALSAAAVKLGVQRTPSARTLATDDRH